MTAGEHLARVRAAKWWTCPVHGNTLSRIPSCDKCIRPPSVNVDPSLTRGDLLRLRLSGETVESIQGEGDMGGIKVTFSNGDEVNFIYFNHKDGMGLDVRP